MARASGEGVAVAAGGECGCVHGLEGGGEGVDSHLGFGGVESGGSEGGHGGEVGVGGGGHCCCE